MTLRESDLMSQSAHGCFINFVKRGGLSKEVAQFCQVKTEAVVNWQEGARWPRGEQMYRLWVFLELKGYEPYELEILPKPTHDLLLIIASGELSFEDVRVYLQYKKMHDVYRMFREGTTPMKERAGKLEQLVEEHLPTATDKLAQYKPVIDVAHEAPLEQVSSAASLPSQLSEYGEQSSLARLLRLVVKRSGEIDSEELKRQLRDVPTKELEAFALLILEIV